MEYMFTVFLTLVYYFPCGFTIPAFLITLFLCALNLLEYLTRTSIKIVFLIPIWWLRYIQLPNPEFIIQTEFRRVYASLLVRNNFKLHFYWIFSKKKEAKLKTFVRNTFQGLYWWNTFFFLIPHPPTDAVIWSNCEN